MALTAAALAGAAAHQARGVLPTEATAPRDAGEPIMAIVSLKSKQVTIYDAAGYCARRCRAAFGDAKLRPASSASWVRTRTTTRTSMTTLVKTDQAKARADERKQKVAAKVAALQTQLDTASAEAKSRRDAGASAQAAAEAAETKRADTAKAAHEAKLALEPVSVFISRATQRLYVRRGFDATMEVPVTIRNPDKPIGTHVFTAVARTAAGLRWTAVTIDSRDNAKSALERITIPKDLLERIAPTALPGSSIIISDEPLNRETNYRTEFIVVLNNQPQGGLAMRHRPASVLARRNFRGEHSFGFGRWFGWNFPFGYARQRGGQYYYRQPQNW